MSDKPDFQGVNPKYLKEKTKKKFCVVCVIDGELYMLCPQEFQGETVITLQWIQDSEHAKKMQGWMAEPWELQELMKSAKKQLPTVGLFYREYTDLIPDG